MSAPNDRFFNTIIQTLGRHVNSEIARTKSPIYATVTSRGLYLKQDCINSTIWGIVADNNDLLKVQELDLQRRQCEDKGIAASLED